ncbi:MAG TPA: murein L,D-transpeptidase catalytic domain family protein [Puia sp.]|nr:murein L,D-transpeptidase catalytic domain family protein [Puia sp.]
MKWLRNSLLLLAGLVMAISLLAAHYYFKGFGRRTADHHAPSASPRELSAATSGRIVQKARALRSFAIAHGYSARIAFLADMRLPSGKNRFFVVDLEKDSVLMMGLVAHGCGDKAFSLDPVFSNVNGSNCTALGKYRISRPYRGQFGLAYKLYGLEPTNDQAFSRNIVLHAYGYVPEWETDPYPICNSRGCPMVAPGFLSRLQPLIDRSPRPILLWILD